MFGWNLSSNSAKAASCPEPEGGKGHLKSAVAASGKQTLKVGWQGKVRGERMEALTQGSKGQTAVGTVGVHAIELRPGQINPAHDQ